MEFLYFSEFFTMTRKERIAATITGIALFCVAALFSIGLLLGLLDFGSTSSRFLPALGQMLLSVYGFCSSLFYCSSGGPIRTRAL